MIKQIEKQLPDEHWSLTLPRRVLPMNFLADRIARPAPFSMLSSLTNSNPEIFSFSDSEFEAWLTDTLPEREASFGCIQQKKMIEFFASAKALNISDDDTVLDAAGGMFSCLHNIQCRKKYLQDMSISQELRNTLGPSIEYLESDAGNIPLPDESIDKISCHHSFEHFQGNSDSQFINEVQRLLKPGGKCAIVPIFIGGRYIEMTDLWSLRFKFDRSSRRLIDPTASLPGRAVSGNYARVYDIQSFQKRVMDRIDPEKATASLVELRMDGSPVPDLSLPGHRTVTAINRPYRMLIITKNGNK